MDTPKNPSFKLNKTNYIFLLIYVVVAFILFFFIQEFSGRALLRAMAKVLGSLFICLVFGYLSWLFSFKNKKIGAWGLNSIVVVLIGYMILSYFQNYQAQLVLYNFKKAEYELNHMIRHDASDEQVDQAYEKYDKSSYQALAQMAENSQGKERQVITVVQSYLKEIDLVISAWQASFDAFIATDVLDPIGLEADPAAYQNRKQIIEVLKADTEKYKKLFTTMEDDIRLKLKPYRMPEEQLNQTIEQIMSSSQFNIEDLEKMTEALLDYLNNHLTALNSLHENPDSWHEKAGELVFEDATFLLEYSRVNSNLSDSEVKLNNIFDTIFGE